MHIQVARLQAEQIAPLERLVGHRQAGVRVGEAGVVVDEEEVSKRAEAGGIVS